MSSESKVGLIICGALGREVKEIVHRRGWDANIYGIPALYHLYPQRITASVRAALGSLRQRYDRLVVVYGDCGTAGSLDGVLGEHQAVRIPGPHCYEMYAGAEFDSMMAERPGTFLLTDWLVRNFGRAVIKGLGLDRYPDLKGVYFGSYTDLVYLRQRPDRRLALKADEIAEYLELPLVIKDVGLGELENRLATLVESVAVS